MIIGEENHLNGLIYSFHESNLSCESGDFDPAVHYTGDPSFGSFCLSASPEASEALLQGHIGDLFIRLLPNGIIANICAFTPISALGFRHV